MNALNVRDSIPDAYALGCIPEAVAREHLWLAYKFDRNTRQLSIAALRYPGKLLQQRAQLLLNESVLPETGWVVDWLLVTNADDLSAALHEAYAESHALDVISGNFSLSEGVNRAQLDEEQWPIGRWFDALLNDAVYRRASDIHVQVHGHEFVVHYRIDGVMQRRTRLPRRLWKPLLARIKVLAQLDLTEHRRPQEGAFERCIHGIAQPVRVALMPHGNSEKITLRLQRSHQSLPKINELFVLEAQRKMVFAALQRQKGLILVAGATGSGKTTTLYSCLLEWLAMGLSLITLEDPIEVTLRWGNTRR